MGTGRSLLAHHFMSRFAMHNPFRKLGGLHPVSYRPECRAATDQKDGNFGSPRIVQHSSRYGLRSGGLTFRVGCHAELPDPPSST